MATLNVSLPDPMRDWVETQAQSGGYDVSAYVQDLIRRDQEGEPDRMFQALVTEGIESGISDRSMNDILEMARQRARDRGL